MESQPRLIGSGPKGDQIIGAKKLERVFGAQAVGLQAVVENAVNP
jgi:hypothetical protein